MSRFNIFLYLFLVCSISIPVSAADGKKKKDKSAKEKGPRVKLKSREWTVGEKKFKALLVKQKYEKKVWLILDEGKKIIVSYKRLSQGDKDYLKAVKEAYEKVEKMIAKIEADKKREAAKHSGPGPLFTPGNQGKVIPEAYKHYALNTNLQTLNQKLGPDYDFYHKNDKTPKVFPEVHIRDPKGERIGVYLHGAPDIKNRDTWNATDWTGMSGQVIYFPDNAGNPGMDRTALCWSRHGENLPKGSKKWFNYYQLHPTRSRAMAAYGWWCANPDPGIANWPRSSFPVATMRSRVAWSLMGLVALRNGVIGSTHCGNGGNEKFPYMQLPPNKIPMDICISNNNEFAFVAIWDVKEIKGQIAVIAIKAGAHRWTLPGLGHSAMKLLGFIDLDKMKAPMHIVTAADFVVWSWAPGGKLYTPEEQKAWAKNPPYSTNGYVMVSSREEDSVAIIDLKPLYGYFRKMYSDPKLFATTEETGEAKDKWPFTFEIAKEAKPTLIRYIKAKRPTAIAAGFEGGNGTQLREFKHRAFIAQEDGELLILDTSPFYKKKAPKNSKLKIIQKLPLGGRNPTCIALGRNSWPTQRLSIVLRGDRMVVQVQVNSKKAVVIKRLQDKRLKDPVWVECWTTRGAQGFSIGDFNGKQIVNYIFDPVDSWGKKYFGGLGKDGKADFECTGSVSYPGRPFMISTAEIP
ncbi:MAG: hypothetical protein HRT89_19675 [Lentisphaeria bacterium]|nr:hypothetical protein [Lentisphaeria bacterium]NQZ70277.1 hypothetical protein [Lentisphaeria bacterium]